MIIIILNHDPHHCHIISDKFREYVKTWHQLLGMFRNGFEATGPTRRCSASPQKSPQPCGRLSNLPLDLLKEVMFIEICPAMPSSFPGISGMGAGWTDEPMGRREKHLLHPSTRTELLRSFRWRPGSRQGRCGKMGPLFGSIRTRIYDEYICT